MNIHKFIIVRWLRRCVGGKRRGSAPQFPTGLASLSGSHPSYPLRGQSPLFLTWAFHFVHSSGKDKGKSRKSQRD